MVLTMICVFGIYFILLSYLTEIIGENSLHFDEETGRGGEGVYKSLSLCLSKGKLNYLPHR